VTGSRVCSRVPPMNSVKAKILVVDDNSQNRALAQATLEDEGYEVLLASDGEEGLRLVEAERPDCVLLDVRMPGTDGFTVCTRIRALPEARDTPVVFLTALRDVDTFDQALRAGGDDFLTKPVRPTELVLRVQAALKLRRMNEELREHYDLVRRQRDDLMRLGLQKERLSSFVVHDLKNPVNSLDLHAQLLLRQPDLPPRARESVLHIRAEARALSRLILNLLDISKSDGGHLTPKHEPVALEALTAEILDAFAIRAQDGRVALKRELAIESVVADGDLLRRVLENLVDNGLRHAPAGSSLTLSAERHADGVDLRVADQGRGIPPEQREKIFEPFVQGTAEEILTRTGRGLGLAFCRLAVQAHGGSIWVDDGNPGTVFRVRLPDRR
jgi:two-component system, sensor histidine kinase and response regulator